MSISYKMKSKHFRLVNRQAEQRWNEITNNEFSKQLSKINVDQCYDHYHDGEVLCSITVSIHVGDIKTGSTEIYFYGPELEVYQEFDEYGWNVYPDVDLPGRYWTNDSYDEFLIYLQDFGDPSIVDKFDDDRWQERYRYYGSFYYRLIRDPHDEISEQHTNVQ